MIPLQAHCVELRLQALLGGGAGPSGGPWGGSIDVSDQCSAGTGLHGLFLLLLLLLGMVMQLRSELIELDARAEDGGCSR